MLRPWRAAIQRVLPHPGRDNRAAIPTMPAMSDASQRIPVAVVGVGRMGRHHARTYSKIAGAKLVGVVDADEERAETIADEYGCRAFPTAEALLAAHPELAAASVAVPTKYHAIAAQPLLERRIACLIEKPLAPTVAEARELAALARQHGTLLQVGHTERFNPAVRAVAAMNLNARFIEVDRVSPMTFRSLDVGVVMDVMIHDLDIVLMLARSPIAKIDAVGVAVLSENEDVANARITFESGCVANIAASRLALKTDRKLRLFSESGYVSLDYQKRSGVVIRASQNDVALQELRLLLEHGQDLSEVDYSSLVHVEELTMEIPPGEEDPLTAELTAFLDAARGGKTPVVDAEAGYAAVEAAERVVASLRAHRWQGYEGAALLRPPEPQIP